MDAKLIFQGLVSLLSMSPRQRELEYSIRCLLVEMGQVPNFKTRYILHYNNDHFYVYEPRTIFYCHLLCLIVLNLLRVKCQAPFFFYVFLFFYEMLGILPQLDHCILITPIIVFFGLHLIYLFLVAQKVVELAHVNKSK